MTDEFTAKQNMVKVRILVMTEPDGRWVAQGWAGAKDEMLTSMLCENAEAGSQAFHAVEAWVPMPVEGLPVIQGALVSPEEGEDA